MRIDERLDLTYCSNIHRGESWAEVFSALESSLSVIRARLAFDGPLAIGLRLSGEAARSLVPIFLEAMSNFDTSQAYLSEVLRLIKAARSPMCLEVETYTWDVLPPEYRTSDMCTAIARELDWVRARLSES